MSTVSPMTPGPGFPIRPPPRYTYGVWTTCASPVRTTCSTSLELGVKYTRSVCVASVRSAEIVRSDVLPTSSRDPLRRNRSAS